MTQSETLAGRSPAPRAERLLGARGSALVPPPEGSRRSSRPRHLPGAPPEAALRRRGRRSSGLSTSRLGEKAAQTGTGCCCCGKDDLLGRCGGPSPARSTRRNPSPRPNASLCGPDLPQLTGSWQPPAVPRESTTLLL